MFPEALLKDPSVAWPGAYAAKFDPWVTKAIQAILQEKLPMQCFLSHDDFQLKISLDTGRGFPKRASQTILLQSNANRNFFALEKLHSFKSRFKSCALNFYAPHQHEYALKV